MELLDPRFSSEACAGRPTKAAADSAKAPVTKALRSISMCNQTAKELFSFRSVCPNALQFVRLTTKE